MYDSFRVEPHHAEQLRPYLSEQLDVVHATASLIAMPFRLGEREGLAHRPGEQLSSLLTVREVLNHD